MKRSTFDNMAIAVILVIFGICLFLFDPVRAVGIAIALIVFYAIIAVNQTHWKQLWFGLIIGLLAGLHVLAVVLLRGRLPDGPALAYVTPCMFVDGFAMYGIVNITEKFMSKRS